MTTFFMEARQMLVPGSEVKHGPLPPLLLAMTLVTGLVDAFSYPLVIALIVTAVIAGATRLISRTDPDWVHAS